MTPATQPTRTLSRSQTSELDVNCSHSDPASTFNIEKRHMQPRYVPFDLEKRSQDKATAVEVPKYLYSNAVATKQMVEQNNEKSERPAANTILKDISCGEQPSTTLPGGRHTMPRYLPLDLDPEYMKQKALKKTKTEEKVASTDNVKAKECHAKPRKLRHADSKFDLPHQQYLL